MNYMVAIQYEVLSSSSHDQASSLQYHFAPSSRFSQDEIDGDGRE